MTYLLPAMTAGMLGYMAWLLVFRLRRDRIAGERALRRSRFAFRARERLRLLFRRAYKLPEQRPEWEEPLVESLDRAQEAPGEREPEPPGRRGSEQPLPGE